MLRNLFALLLALALSGFAASHSDNWNQNTGSEQGIATYGNYTLMEGSLTVPTGNLGRYSMAGSDYNTARRNDASPTADQYSQVVITAAQRAGGHYAGPMVRGQTGANSSYHVETNGDGNVYLSKCLAGSQSTLTTLSQVLSDNDVLRLEVTGTGGTVTLKVYRAAAASPTSFTQIGSDYNDSSSPITGAGQYGVFGYASGPGGGAWEAGDLGGGGGSTPAARSTLLGVGH